MPHLDPDTSLIDVSLSFMFFAVREHFCEAGTGRPSSSFEEAKLHAERTLQNMTVLACLLLTTPFPALDVYKTFEMSTLRWYCDIAQTYSKMFIIMIYKSGYGENTRVNIWRSEQEICYFPESNEILSKLTFHMLVWNSSNLRLLQCMMSATMSQWIWKHAAA